MIDTDKYEGHTPAPWSVGHEGQHDLHKDDIPINGKLGGLNAIAYEETDAKLIAAAPELLADNKGLQRLLWMHDICDYCAIEAHDCSCYWCESCDSRADSFHDISGDFIICCKCYEACECKEMK